MQFQNICAPSWITPFHSGFVKEENEEHENVIAVGMLRDAKYR